MGRRGDFCVKFDTIIDTMLRMVWFLLICWATTLSAQVLQVKVTPKSIYAGDVFRVEASVDGVNLESVSCSFATPAQVIGQSMKMSVENGRISSSQSLQVLPQGVGECRIESVTAVTQDGKTLTYTQPHTVQVRELPPDGEVFLETALSPEAPLPGDDVTVTLTIRAPAVRNGDRLLSPFLEQDIFGRVQERIPRIQFEAVTGEDSPLRQLAQPRLVSQEAEGNQLVWTVECAYRAVRVGEQIFPAPFIRDTRYRLAPQGGSLEEVRCLVMGSPVTVRVSPPPTEGRPDGFVGAVAERFAAEVALDTLNAKAGDPVKLTISFFTDADPEQLRLPHLPELKGFRTYGEPVRNTIEGGVSFVYNLRPVQAGLHEIPSLSFAWFEKTGRIYQITRTTAVPLYVHPSAQLVLLGEDGEALSDVLPPALRLSYPPKATLLPRVWVLAVLLVGLLALLARLLLNPARRIWYRVVQRLTRKRLVRRVCAALRRVRTPEEALAAIRTWVGRPALTAVELRGMLEESVEAQAAIAAMAQLEHAVYSGGEDVPEARETLVKLLPQVKFKRMRHAGMRPVVVLLCCLLPSALMAMEDDFLLEQAEAVTLAASTPEDYAAATDLWLRLAREGNVSSSVLLNGAGCAIFARQPLVAKRLVTRYELLYGRDQESEQALIAAMDRLETPLFWGRTLFAPHYDFGLSKRLEWWCIAVGIGFLLLAVPWRGLRGLRVLVGLGILALSVSLLVSLMSLAQTNVYDALPDATETEEVQ